MSDRLLSLAAELRQRDEPFALAIVVRCERPTSAKPGAKALPKPLLVLIGHGPVVETLAALGRAVDYAVETVGSGTGADAIDRLALSPRASVVVATHGELDEGMLGRVLSTSAGYVSLVASRKRTVSVLESLRQRGVPMERLGRLKAPAGLDIGAVTPAEIAVSILAEIIQLHRSDKWAAVDSPAPPSTGLRLAAGQPMTVAAAPGAQGSVDPICGMTVDATTARHRSEAGGRTVYFCCGGCKTRFDAAPERYPPR